MGFKGSPLHNLENGIDRPDIRFPDIHCPHIHCPDIHCPDIHCPSIHYPKIYCSDIHCTDIQSMDIDCPDIHIYTHQIRSYDHIITLRQILHADVRATRHYLPMFPFISRVNQNSRISTFKLDCSPSSLQYRQLYHY